MSAPLLPTSCLESAVVLAVGTGLIVGLAGLAAAWARSAAWSRTAWQVGVLATCSLLLVELTGMGTAMVELARVHRDTAAATEARPYPRPDQDSPFEATEQNTSFPPGVAACLPLAVGRGQDGRALDVGFRDSFWRRLGTFPAPSFGRRNPNERSYRFLATLAGRHGSNGLPHPLGRLRR